MHTYFVYISIIVVALLIIPGTALAGEDIAHMFKSDRPTINPDFNPDYSCLFDTFQLKCVPGSEQECPNPQFASAEPQTCWAKTLINGEWVRHCPDGYHTTDGDETGQCYPNSNGCSDAALLSKDRSSRFEYILLTGSDSPNPYDTCANPRYLCDDKPDHSGCEEFREWSSKYYPNNQ